MAKVKSINHKAALILSIDLFILHIDFSTFSHINMIKGEIECMTVGILSRSHRTGDDSNG